MTSEGRHITRMRPSLSCLACRRRKVKCEKQRPACDSCLKVNEVCVYDARDSDAASQSRKRKSTDSGAARPMPGADRDQATNDSVPKASSTARPLQRNVHRPDYRRRRALSSISSTSDRDEAGPNNISGAVYSDGSGHRWNGAAEWVGAAGTFPQKSIFNPAAVKAASQAITLVPALPLAESLSTDARAAHAHWDATMQDAATTHYHDPPGSAELRSSLQYASKAKQETAIGHFSIQGGGRRRYVESTFWALTGNETTYCENYLRDKYSSNSARPDRYLNAPGLAKVLHTLPSKSLCDLLLKSFLVGVRPVFPLIHVPTFQAEYDAFWHWCRNSHTSLPDEKLIDDPSFLPLLFAILLCGAVAASPSLLTDTALEGLKRAALVEKLRSTVHITLRLCQYTRLPTLNTLLASVLMHSCSDFEDEPLTSVGFVSMAMRIAQSMGLHRDGSFFGLDEVESEVRRRVWWHIVYLDVQTTISSGLQPSCGSSSLEYHCDSSMVSELRDEDIRSSSSHRPARCEKASSAMLLSIGRHETTKVLRQIIERLYGIRNPTITDFEELSMVVKRLNATIENLISRLPAKGIPEKGYIPSLFATADPLRHEKLYQDDLDSPTIFNSWARIVLTIMKSNASILLFRPYLAHTSCAQSRAMWIGAVQICCSLLRNFLQLARLPAFQPYYWYSPGKSQPLQATIIILAYLQRWPETPNSQFLRYLVDETMDIFDEQEDTAYNQGAPSEYRPYKRGGIPWGLLKDFRNNLSESSQSSNGATVLSNNPLQGTTKSSAPSESKPIPPAPHPSASPTDKEQRAYPRLHEAARDPGGLWTPDETPMDDRMNLEHFNDAAIDGFGEAFHEFVYPGSTIATPFVPDRQSQRTGETPAVHPGPDGAVPSFEDEDLVIESWSNILEGIEGANREASWVEEWAQLP